MDQKKIEENLELFKELISCNANLYLWSYDADYNLIQSNCPYESVLSTMFSLFGCKEYLYTYAKDHDVPLGIGTPIGLQWIAAFHKEAGELIKIYMIGPAFNTEVSMNEINHAMGKSQELNISHTFRHELYQAVENAPAISPMIWNQYAIMLHYCVTGEKIRISDIINKHGKVMLADGRQVQKDRHKTWLAERNLIRVIQEGDLNYKDALNRTSLLSSGVPIQSKDPVRQAKDSVIVSITLCTRAAIEGGMTPEQAYSLGDSYIQAVEDACNPADIGSIHDTMFEDFVLRMHKLRSAPHMTPQIRTCCDYIQIHVEERLNIEVLAEQIGYSKYYLSRRFKEEVGTSINDYIKIARTERAKTLLLTTDKSVLDIAYQLQFCSRSHFSETFREIVGCTPVEFREKNQ